MSDEQEIELTRRLAELYERASAPAGDDAALAELDQLLRDDSQARQVYLSCVWMHAHLPFSVSLQSSGEDKPSVSSTAGLPAVATAATESTEATGGFLWSGIGATVMVVTLLGIALLFSGSGEYKVTEVAAAGSGQTGAVSSVDDSTMSESGPKSAQNGTVDSDAGSQQTAVTPPVFNNVAHPPGKGKLQGGIADEKPVPEKISFNQHVRGILSENCYYCHGPDPNHREADLRLDTADGSEYVVEAGQPDDSELIARILSDDPDMQMPPPDSGRVIVDYQKRILKRWIEQGARYEDHWAFIAAKKPELPAVENESWVRNEIDRFVLAKLEMNGITPSQRAEPEVIARRLYLDLLGLPPKVEQIQDFVQSYSADADASVDALVTELLASPHYGERMSLPWLDAARYSDSNGFQQDGDRNQWPWRDWVVGALNDNMPFDQFTVEQLAGDLLENPTESQLIATAFNRNHMLNGEGGALEEEQRNNYVFDRVDTTATTWLGLTMACAQCHDHKYDPIKQTDYYSFFAYFNSVDENGGVNHRAGRLQCAKPVLELPTDEQQQQLKDITKQTDPIFQKLEAAKPEITESMRLWEVDARENPPKDMNRDLFRILKREPDEREGWEENQLRDYYVEKFGEQPWKGLKLELKKLEGERKKVQATITTVMIMRDREHARKTHLLERGDYESQRDEVQPAVPGFLPGLPDANDLDANDPDADDPDADDPDADEVAPNRLALARWLVDPVNPLTNRVTVNRFWQTFFSIGLVKTSEDFGVQGELPSHPELLDWLAVDFVESGWDVKRMHRMIVTSETYLQSSRFRKDLADLDPENRLLARSPRFRLPSSLIRDAALSVSGLLNASVGGEPVYPYQPEGLWKEFSLERFTYKPSTGGDLYRRSLYTFWRRTVAPPNMFDSANRQTCSVKPSRTNTPLHALVMLNDPTFVETFRNLAQAVIANDAAENDPEKLRLAFSRALGRTPKRSELAALTAALQASRSYFSEHQQEATELISIGESAELPEEIDQQIELAAFTSVVQIVMNTDEFMTRE